MRAVERPRIIRADIARSIESYSIPDGDRGDPVARALRRFYQRVMLCPCMDQSCIQCKYDIEDIEAAWDASASMNNLDKGVWR